MSEQFGLGPPATLAVMPPTIENPILNSPFHEPERHFRFGEEASPRTSSRAGGARTSCPSRRRRRRPPASWSSDADTWTAERVQDNDFINRVRGRSPPGATATRASPRSRASCCATGDEDRAQPLFFCQIEALETAIYLAEVAGQSQPWIETRLREENEAKNPGLYRLAFKMATGSGKTVVMAMLIAWQTLNKLANPQDKRFCDAFLVVTPGITIRDRLRVLLPNDPGNYYASATSSRPSSCTPPGGDDPDHQLPRLPAPRARSRPPADEEGPRRPGRRPGPLQGDARRRWSGASPAASGRKKNIVVLNDEAHHCYPSAPAAARRRP